MYKLWPSFLVCKYYQFLTFFKELSCPGSDFSSSTFKRSWRFHRLSTDHPTLSSWVESWWPPVKSLCTDFHPLALQALRWERRVTDSINHINFIVLKDFSFCKLPTWAPSAALTQPWDYPVEAWRQKMKRSKLLFSPTCFFQPKFIITTSQLFVFSFGCAEQIPPTQKVAGEDQSDSSLYIFPVTEVPEMLSLEIGAVLRQHPKHPTKPKRRLFWTTGTKLLSVTTAQRFKPAPRLCLCVSTRETRPWSPRWVEHLPLGWCLLHIFSCERHLVACFYKVWILYKSSHKVGANILPPSLPCGTTRQAQTSFLPPSTHGGKSPSGFVLFLNLSKPGL